MIEVKVKANFDRGKVQRATKAGTITSLGRAGAYIRGIARRSIKVSKDPAAPGRPPHTRKGRLKKAIFFSVEGDRQDVVIGPTSSAVGRVGHTHEFGGKEPPRRYPPRPFMGPALEVSKARLPKFWANSVKG